MEAARRTGVAPTRAMLPAAALGAQEQAKQQLPLMPHLGAPADQAAEEDAGGGGAAPHTNVGLPVLWSVGGRASGGASVSAGPHAQCMRAAARHTAAFQRMHACRASQLTSVWDSTPWYCPANSANKLEVKPAAAQGAGGSREGRCVWACTQGRQLPSHPTRPPRCSPAKTEKKLSTSQETAKRRKRATRSGVGGPASLSRASGCGGQVRGGRGAAVIATRGTAPAGAGGVPTHLHQVLVLLGWVLKTVPKEQAQHHHQRKGKPAGNGVPALEQRAGRQAWRRRRWRRRGGSGGDGVAAAALVPSSTNQAPIRACFLCCMPTS